MNDEIRELYDLQCGEIQRLFNMHMHCSNCGGSWLDDGINGGCTCIEIQQLRKTVVRLTKELERIRRQTAKSAEEKEDGRA